MRNRCECRLTVIGVKQDVAAFQRSHWLIQLQGRYQDPLELSPRRFVCVFETDGHDLSRLQKLSRRWPGLVFLLDYEVRRIKGLAKAKGGELEHCEIGY